MLCEFLEEKRSVASVAVVAGMQPGALAQKISVEQSSEDFSFTVQKLARYDIHEEVYNHQLSDSEQIEWCGQLLKQEPDAILLCGFLPELVPMALRSLRTLGYSGEIVVLDGRGP